MRFLLLFVSAPLFGQYLPNIQFSDLVTTRDGSVLYFSSPMNLRGDAEVPYQKIFRIDSAGIHPAVQIERTGPPNAPNLSNFYLAIEPDVNADGSIFSYVATRICVGGSSCLFFEHYEGHVLAGGDTKFSGRVRLSRDGRFALRYGSTGIPFPSDPLPQLVDLSTNRRIPVPGQILEGRPIGSGATVLTSIDGALQLWSPAGTHPLPLTSRGRVVLSDNAATIAVEGGNGIILYDVQSGAETDLPGDGDASISDDGRLVSFLRGGQVVLYDLAAKAERKLPASSDSVREAVISGDGRTIWEATDMGRIVRVNTASGDASELVARTPFITQVSGAPVPGSLNWIDGSGLSSTSFVPHTPLPEYVPGVDGGLGVILGSTPARVARVTPTEIQIQIPFEAQTGTARVSLVPNDSRFEQAELDLQIVPYVPLPLLTVIDEPVIAHADFSALINTQKPAVPGEVMHAYFTGLGQTTPPLPSGVAAPLDRLSPAQAPACDFGSDQPANILFAGMAPGMIGIYQVDVRLPSQIPFLNPSGSGFAFFTCHGTMGDSYVFLVPMQSAHN